MNNFKVCFKILKKNLAMLLITLLLPFIVLYMQLSFFDDTNQGFVDSKPNIYIINNDKENDLTKEEKKFLINKSEKEKKKEINKLENKKKDESKNESLSEIQDKIKGGNKNITKNFLTYMYLKTIVQEFNQEGKELENILDDSLYLDQISIILEIPENFRKDILEGKTPEIKIEKNSFRSADLSKMIIDKYIRNISLYNKENIKEEDLIKLVSEIVNTEVETEMNKNIKTVALQKSEFIFSFITYSIISSVLTINLVILYYFSLKAIKKRIDISSEKKFVHKMKLFFSMLGVTSIIIFVYILFTYIFVNINITKSYKGMLYGVNAFLFGISIMSLSFLLSKFIRTIGGASGITVVISLAMSFLSGAFVPREILPEITVKISKILPSFYYVDNVIKISNADEFNKKILENIFSNFGIIALFTLIFGIISYLLKNFELEKISKENKI